MASALERIKLNVKTVITIAVTCALAVGCGVTESPVPREPVIEMGPQFGNPTRLIIPRIGVNVPLVALGLTPEGAHEIPPIDQPMVTGWFQPGPEPGEPGRSIILGHVNGRVNGESTPGIFARLDEVQVNDEVQIDSQIFMITGILTEPKTEFPADVVYGNEGVSELRLVTCGGDFDPQTRHYKDNVIVSARKVADVNRENAGGITGLKQVISR